MTREELRTIQQHLLSQPQLHGVEVVGRDIDERFVVMRTGPCPFYLFNRCAIYEVRPYNCRRFSCLRQNTKTERFELDKDGKCLNYEDRVSYSQDARKQAGKIQRRAQAWALAHGWRTNDA